MDIIKGFMALLVMVALGVGTVVVVVVAVAVVAVLAATARFWAPALLVLFAIGAVITIACAIANNHGGGGS